MCRRYGGGADSSCPLSQASPDVAPALARTTATRGRRTPASLHGDSSDRPGDREVLPRRRRHDHHAQAGRRPPHRRRPRGADRRSRARAWRPTGAARSPGSARSTSPAARCARRWSGSGPTSCTPSPPAPLGRKALKHARRLGVPTLVVQHARSPSSPARSAGQVAARADRSWSPPTSSPTDSTSSASTPPCGSRASTPAPSAPACGTSGCTTSGRAPGPATAAGSWSGYAGSLHKRHGVRRLAELADLPGISLVVIGEGPQRVWLERHLPARQVHRRPDHRRPRGRPGLARPARAPRRGGDVLPRPARGRGDRPARGRPACRRGARRRPRPGDRPALRPPTGTGLRRAVEAVAGDRHRALMGERGPRAQHPLVDATRAPSWWPSTTPR